MPRNQRMNENAELLLHF